MADTKISALTAVVTPASTDEFAVNQSALSKKMTLAQITQQGSGPVFNVKHYGATGDGTTDDTTAIHAARDAAGTGTVYFPKGTYSGGTFTASVVGQTWLFAGGAILKAKAALNASLLTVSGTDVKIIGGEFDGNKLNQTSGTTGISLSAARTLLEGAYVHDTEGVGVGIYSDYIVVRNCYLKDIGSSTGDTNNGIFADSGADYALIESNRLDLPGGNGIKIKGDNASVESIAPRIIGNIVTLAAGHDQCIEVWGLCPRSVIANNHVTGGNMGISVDKSHNSAISGNTCYANSIQAIELAGSTDCSVTGNSINGNDGASSVGVSVTNANNARNSIVGNTIRNVNVGIRLQNAPVDTTVMGNVISNWNSKALLAVDAVRTVISGNVFSNDITTVHAIELEGNCTDAVIMGNLFKNVDAALSLYADTGKTENGITFALNRLLTATTIIQQVGAGTHGTDQRWIDNAPATLDTNKRNIQFVIDGGGATITAGVKGIIESPITGQIEQATITADQSGSIVVDLWKDSYANYPPTVADTITASAKPTLASAIKAQDSVLTGWNKTITKGDWLAFNVEGTPANVQRVTISLLVREGV